MPLSKIKGQMSHTVFTSKIAKGSDIKPWRDCCNAQAPATHLCYEYISNEDNEVNKHDTDQYTINCIICFSSKRFACLPGRMMVSAQEDCMTKQDCLKNDGYVCAKAYTGYYNVHKYV